VIGHPLVSSSVGSSGGSGSDVMALPLEELDLSNNDLRPGGLEAIAQSIIKGRFPHLTKVS